MIEPNIISTAANLLLEAAPKGSQVILFGSFARGDAREDSDLDFLVVEPQVKDRINEMARLYVVLKDLPVPVDILVASYALYEYWRDTPNTVYYQAMKEGKRYGQDEVICSSPETKKDSSPPILQQS
ncbi:MAG: nucleotidyltransferase domain-containing protein [Candidatus Sumerlaeota bacterium]|nr:nucleotidyltransferase domain-containing protein [Candidatus Sumerlaeota bacterium]